ncbi:hypothetical protein NVV93_02735 [Pseudomonas sp. LS44]|uniref:hypothetical protein n=1 Tax=Pseudomonas sp. LS44 TaxID=1357074 RepID=UPI00215A450C|nr:hypothetical protein [Pseudomonas sp. LS44]UVE18337.1 hypothetical protein NVV93_02735 [Pseudomonas sp. LS44]
MTTTELIRMAEAEGLVLALDGKRLIWSADVQPPDELLADLKAQKSAIVQALHCRWLARVAALLECSPTYLMEHGFIDSHDLAEQCGMHPRFAAQLVRSHPEWKAAKLQRT